MQEKLSSAANLRQKHETELMRAKAQAAAQDKEIKLLKKQVRWAGLGMYRHCPHLQRCCELNTRCLPVWMCRRLLHTRAGHSARSCWTPWDPCLLAMGPRSESCSCLLWNLGLP